MNYPILNSSFEPIRNVFMSSYLPQIINVTIEMGILEKLAEKEMSLQEICVTFELDCAVTDALLKILYEVGFLEKKADNYGLSLMSADFLVSSSPMNQISQLSRINGSSGAFDHLADALKGKKVEFKGEMWSSRESAISIQKGAMAGSVQNVISFAKELPGFDSCIRMCDMAGNIGYYSFALMSQNPDLHAHVFELPAVCELAKEIQFEQPAFDRIQFHEFDMKKGDDWGNNYDLFFISHFLYEFDIEDLTDFFIRVNKSMCLGGIFISNHMYDGFGEGLPGRLLSQAITELQTRLMGYPTHQLPEKKMKQALTIAGFGDFQSRKPDYRHAHPSFLLSAVKLKEAQ